MTNCAQTAGQPSQCKNWSGGKKSKYSYGGITYLAPGAQKTGTGYMAKGCSKTAFGISCNAQKTGTGYMAKGCSKTAFGISCNAQKTGTGYMASGCRKTAFGIVCNAQKTPTGFMGANCRRTAFGIQCSDMRLKHDIIRVGTAANGLALYRFKYLWSGQVYVGVMAQDVLAVRPDAVLAGGDGYLMVDYAKLGVPFETWHQWLQHAR